VITLLLDRRGYQITVTEEIVRIITERFDREVIILLLDQRGDQIIVTEEVVKAAAGNKENGKQVITLLLDRRGHQITVTEEVVKAAAGNEGNGKEVTILLLDQRGYQITVTEEVVKAAAGNYWEGKEVMKLLLDRRGHQITITEEVVKAAAGNKGNRKGVITLLLDRRREATIASITEEIFTAAATCGQILVLDLLSRQTGLISVQDQWRYIAKFFNAAEAGDIRCVEQLMREGTKPDMKNIRGETPLWIAAKYGRDAVVKVLTQSADVNVNSTSITGRSPLFWPSENGDERVVFILMEAGADPNLVDQNGDRAVTVARKKGRKRTVKILERSGRTN